MAGRDEGGSGGGGKRRSHERPQAGPGCDALPLDSTPVSHPVVRFVQGVPGKTIERVPRIPLYPVSPLHVDLP